MTELDKILELIKDCDYQILKNISDDLFNFGKYHALGLHPDEKKAIGIMLYRAIMYLIKEDLKVK